MNVLRNTLNGLALLCIAGLSACANPVPLATAATATGCAEQEITSEQLVGSWRISLVGQAGTWTLVLRPHPEHEGSLRGALMQIPQHYAVAADLEDGEFTMEESHDGQRIAATWLGKVQVGSCAQVITGTHQEGTGAEQRFEMRSERLR